MDGTREHRRPWHHTNYDLRYQKTTETGWTNGSQNLTGNSTRIYGMVEGTAYCAQARATNNGADGPWSPSTT